MAQEERPEVRASCGTQVCTEVKCPGGRGWVMWGGDVRVAEICIVLRQPKERKGFWLPKKMSNQAVCLSTAGSSADLCLIRTGTPSDCWAPGLTCLPSWPAAVEPPAAVLLGTGTWPRLEELLGSQGQGALSSLQVVCPASSWHRSQRGRSSNGWAGCSTWLGIARVPTERGKVDSGDKQPAVVGQPCSTPTLGLSS